VFADVGNDATTAREEIFGPVMSVIPFSSIDEVVAMSNDNEYGLAAAVWTNDVKKAMLTARALRADVVWINDSQPGPTETPWAAASSRGSVASSASTVSEDFLESKSVYLDLC
jgi:acyl-CoA reductase-like NAD-dependent aldehyde dehydrogenase